MEIKAEKTQRGFTHLSFVDRSGVACSIQASSLATESAIWFGCSNPDARILVPGEGWTSYQLAPGTVINDRMHLTQNQVRDLLPTLMEFAKSGELPSEAVPVAETLEREEMLKEVLSIGQMLSNAVYGLKQDQRLDEQTRSTLKENQEAWDRAYREWFKIPTKLKER